MTRSDKGKPRKKLIREPKRLTLYLAGYGSEAMIANALEEEVARKNEEHPGLNVIDQDVLKDWLRERLKIEKGE